MNDPAKPSRVAKAWDLRTRLAAPLEQANAAEVVETLRESLLRELVEDAQTPMSDDDAVAIATDVVLGIAEGVSIGFRRACGIEALVRRFPAASDEERWTVMLELLETALFGRQPKARASN